MEAPLIPFTIQRDPRGTLVALEEASEVPFHIRRMYFIYRIPPGVRRGGHAHRKNRQMAVAVVGSCHFVLDDGQSRVEVRLDRPDRGLLVERMIWHEMRDFSSDCVLIMLASEPFDEADYIRSYDAFLEAVR